MKQIWTDGPAPDSTLNMFCPHCATWYASSSHPLAFSELYEEAGKVRQRFFCMVGRDRGVELIDAAAHGTLTPWQEWKRDGLIAEMDHLDRESERILKELNDYYDYQDGRGV